MGGDKARNARPQTGDNIGYAHRRPPATARCSTIHPPKPAGRRSSFELNRRARNLLEAHLVLWVSGEQ
jgi:hypothetical protein